MRARCVSYSGDRATVVLEPSWIGRLLGCRTMSVDLEYAVRAACDGYREWRTVATRRWVDGLDAARAIMNALDFREVGSPPRRSLASVSEAVTP